MQISELVSRTHRRWLSPQSRLRIAFVIPWYGQGIGGGAEAQCRGLVQGIRKLYPDVEVEVITTCLKEFAADWNHNSHREGTQLEDGVKVHRFRVEEMHRGDFGKLNYFRLMPHLTDDLWRGGKPMSPLLPKEEKFYIKHMIRSRSLDRYLKWHRYSYDFFLFMPYMFATSCLSSELVAGRAVMIPCLHDERYAYMDIYRHAMQRARGVLFNAPAEQRLFQRLYGADDSNRQCVSGETVATDVAFADAEAFRQKFAISDPFFLYAGRLVEGKNVPLLVDYFMRYKRAKGADDQTKLVLIGRGDLSYPREAYPDIRQLGFLSVTDKLGAYRAAEALLQPSLNESFSIVMMEAWLQETPVIVHGSCEVTADHCALSGGGLVFTHGDTFNLQLDHILADRELRDRMGRLGRDYVLANFTEKIVIDRIITFLRQLKKNF